LIAPGIGTFEATRPDVPLQQVSALRDRHLVETRSRFSSGVKTSDSRMPAGLVFELHTTLRPNRRVFAVQP
jgi:hypothetical protein